MTDVLSCSAGKYWGTLVGRTCVETKHVPVTDGCFPYPYGQSAKKNFGLRGMTEVGDSGWPDNGGSGLPGWPTDMPDMPDYGRNFSGGFDLPKPPDIVENGTVCVCNTDLCNGKTLNEIGGNNGVGDNHNSVQNSGSPYFTVICVLLLIALSAASDIGDGDDEL